MAFRDESLRIIAEIGANHDGSAEVAHRMLDAVADAGASLVKFQLYTAEELVADRDRPVRWGPPDQLREETVGAMFDRIALPREAFPEVFAHAREHGLTPFATPFSEDGVDFLMSLDVTMFKIASSDVTHERLLRHVAGTGRPVLMSLGKSTLAEAMAAVDTLRNGGCEDLALLHCVATYPSPIEEMNLRVMDTLRTTFPHCAIGLSDHSEGLLASFAAIARGAAVVERHVTLDRAGEGPDHWFSITLDELGELVAGGRRIRAALGSPDKTVTPSEAAGRTNATRSVVAARDLASGAILTADDLKVVRPGTGLSPRFVDVVVGMEIRVDVAADTPLDWAMFRA